MTPLQLTISSLLAAATATALALTLGPAWDMFSRWRIGQLAPRMRSLGLDDRRAVDSLRWWGLALAAIVIAFTLYWQAPLLGAGVLLLAYLAPALLLDGLVRRRKIVLRDQMVRAAVALANCARAGMALMQGFELIAKETPDPLGAELRRITDQYAAGRPMAQALQETQRRLDLESFTTFAIAVVVCHQRGGKMGVALDRISQGLLETQRLERKIEADTAAGRRMAVTLAAVPVIFVVAFSMLDPRMIEPLFHTVPGHVTLLIVGGMVYVSLRWCLWLVQFDI